jgi:hypothetical protein
VDPALTVGFFGLGSAVLGFWTVVRFPSLGPQSVMSSIVVTAAAFLSQTPLLGLVDPAIAALGTPGALLLVILPSLALLFWAAGCLVRSLVALAAPYRR